MTTANKSGAAMGTLMANIWSIYMTKQPFRKEGYFFLWFVIQYCLRAVNSFARSAGFPYVHVCSCWHPVVVCGVKIFLKTFIWCCFFFPPRVHPRTGGDRMTARWRKRSRCGKRWAWWRTSSLPLAQALRKLVVWFSDLNAAAFFLELGHRPPPLQICCNTELRAKYVNN